MLFLKITGLVLGTLIAILGVWDPFDKAKIKKNQVLRLVLIVLGLAIAIPCYLWDTSTKNSDADTGKVKPADNTGTFSSAVKPDTVHLTDTVKIAGPKKRPNIQIKPYATTINPRIVKVTADSAIYYEDFLNCGEANAKALHIETLALIRLDEDSFKMPKIINRASINEHREISPDCEKDFVRNTFSGHYTGLPDCYFYLVIAYCYKDDQHSIYFPPPEIFEWQFKNMDQAGAIVDDKTYNEIEEVLRRDNRWPTKPF